MFYVYALVDPRDGRTFYIGKGTGQRAYQHVKEAKSKRVINKAKRERILAILADGSEPKVEMLKRFKDEKEALEEEARLIRTVPGLTNIMLCGFGSALSAEERAKRSDNAVREFMLKWWKKHGHPPFLAMAGLPGADDLNARFNRLTARLLGIEVPGRLIGRTLDGREMLVHLAT